MSEFFRGVFAAVTIYHIPPTISGVLHVPPPGAAVPAALFLRRLHVTWTNDGSQCGRRLRIDFGSRMASSAERYKTAFHLPLFQVDVNKSWNKSVPCFRKLAPTRAPLNSLTFLIKSDP